MVHPLPAGFQIQRAINHLEVAMKRNPFQVRPPESGLRASAAGVYLASVILLTALKIGCVSGTGLRSELGRTNLRLAAHCGVEGLQSQAVVDEQRAAALEESLQGGNRRGIQVKVIQAGQVKEGKRSQILLARAGPARA